MESTGTDSGIVVGFSNTEGRCVELSPVQKC